MVDEKRLDPGLVDHALALAAQHLQDAAVAAPPPDPGPRAWFVLQTVMHGEDEAKEALEGEGFRVFMPVLRREIYVRYLRKVAVREFKLFNRYLFAELPVVLESWGRVWSIEAIDCALGASGRPQAVRNTVIAEVMAADAAGAFDETLVLTGRQRRGEARARFPVGSRARAKAGPFSGFSGMVTSVTGQGAVKVMIELFRSMVPVEFKPGDVEPE